MGGERKHDEDFKLFSQIQNRGNNKNILLLDQFSSSTKLTVHNEFNCTVYSTLFSLKSLYFTVQIKMDIFIVQDYFKLN